MYLYHMDYLLHRLFLFMVLHYTTDTCIHAYALLLFSCGTSSYSVSLHIILSYMVICIIIHHPYIYLLFRLPLLLQRLQVIFFYFIISHITLHVFLVTPHDTLFMIISVSTCFIVSYWVFYYIFHYYY